MTESLAALVVIGVQLLAVFIVTYHAVRLAIRHENDRRRGQV